MNLRSPFQNDRWERDDQHLIWIPPEFAEWERKDCVYLTGSRGSGKTTILRAFEWKERLNNESLKAQLGPDPFAKRYIGIYLNTPSYITNRFIDWPPRSKDINDQQWEEEKGRLYSLYLEYQILQLFVEAIQGLREKFILKFQPEDEKETISEILSERPEINIFISKGIKEPRLNDIRLSFKSMHENIRFHAIKKRELQPERGYPTLQMGKMLEEISGLLINLCCKGEDRNYGRWFLKICIDQTESIEPYQLKSINTIVAGLETGDVSFVISSLNGSKDISDTFIPRHPLTYADRKHVSLEEIYRVPSKFHEFVSAVTNMRFCRFLDCKDITVDLKYLLGEWDINSLLNIISFKKSEKESVREFMRRSKENSENYFFKVDHTINPIELNRAHGAEIENIDEYLPENDSKSSIPPFYHTYLIEKLNIDIPEYKIEKYKVRSLKSREFRKKMVSAMICLCKEYSLQIPYAGYNMVISMSDQSIRDFLLQMHNIYLQESLPAEKFAKKRILPKKQNKAIRKASEDRYERVGKEAEARTKEIVRLVSSLGRITSEIQSAYNNLSSLKSIERGRFDIDLFSLSKGERADLREVLDLANDCHSIKMLKNTPNKVLIRLHRLFAPKFGFSYRGAYSDVSLPGDVLLKLCRENDDIVRGKLEEKVAQSIICDRDINAANFITLEKWSK